MSFQATLTVEGKTFNVLQCHHTLSQKYDRGRPTSGVRGGIIVLILDGSDEDLLGDWATGATTKKSGDITFNRTDQQSTLQKLEFEDAYATMYSEFMSAATLSHASISEDVEDLMNTDAGPHDDDYKLRLITNRRRLIRFVERTGSSYCTLIRLAAEKIKLDGIDHQNT